MAGSRNQALTSGSQSEQSELPHSDPQVVKEEDKRATTNVQHRFVQLFLFYLFLSFVLLELKPFVFKLKVLGAKF